MRVLSLVLKIAFPLTPFFMGALIRVTHVGLSWRAFNPAELSFSMALLTMIMSTYASRLDNKDLRDSLVSVFRFLMIAFLVIFAVTLFIQIDISEALILFAGEAQDCVVNQTVLPPEILPTRLQHFGRTLDVLRTITVVLSIVVAPFAVYTSIRYDLKETSPSCSAA